MNAFNTDTDWMRNKNTTAIVYHHALGEEIITLEIFLAASSENTPKMFAELKAKSDELYKAEDDAERTIYENELPLYYESEKCAAPSIEDSIFGDSAGIERQAYLERSSWLSNLLPQIKAKLTLKQFRRLLMARHDGLTVRQIAKIEGCSHPSVIESLHAADKKIKKIMTKAQKHPTKHGEG
jgi:DNA-directed RNA polymerase specialized sigma24 family protein